MHYVSYLLDLVEARAIAATVAHAPSPVLPENAFAWKVVCDTAGTVVVRGMIDQRLAPLATARWTGELVDRKQVAPELPNDHQWRLVETSLGQLLAAAADRPQPTEPLLEPAVDLAHEATRISRARAKEIDAQIADRHRPKPEARPVAPEWHARQRNKRLVNRVASIAVGAGLLALVVLVIVAQVGSRSPDKVAAPPPPPKPAIDAAVARPPTIDERVASAASLPEALALAKPISTTLVARYAVAKLRFAEVDAAETTLAHVEKDYQAELGKRVCVDGEIRRIERADLDRRKVFVGELLVKARSGPDDRVTFLAVGTTGELVKRDRARFCGVVTDKLQLVGMFDLPENRTPAVEQ